MAFSNFNFAKNSCSKPGLNEWFSVKSHGKVVNVDVGTEGRGGENSGGATGIQLREVHFFDLVGDLVHLVRCVDLQTQLQKWLRGTEN